MLISFIFYFLGGYLLYASMFAAIGAAVDNETDTQQFMLPITVPIILALVMMPSVIENPSGSLAIWLSMIPFTSPISMMMRIPFGVPYIELVISAIILVFTFVGMTWAAGKIYRTGILMYGKKVSYKELWKWIRYNG
jgi:ABC-2 type transport system permease protein